MRASRSTRRGFLERLAGAGTLLIASSGVGACAANAMHAPQGSSTQSPWDLRWLEAVRKARHRAVFDGPQGDIAPMLAARWLDGVQAAYGARAPEAIAVINLRTASVALGLSDRIWAAYPVAEDRKVNDPATGAPSRRNPAWSPAPGVSAPEREMSLEQLTARGAIPVVCDFALGHLATRLATATGKTRDVVQAELRAGVIPGAFLAPSGIFAMAEAQNAGAAYVPG